ncbi:FG-GAP-like repeat-containing protein, partial [Microcoleus sp. N9_B2]
MKTLPQINRSLNNNIGSLVGCTSNKPTSIVILDPTIPDSQHLISGIKPDTATYILKSQPDAVEQIATILAQHTGIETLHIITHGDSGKLYLGTTELNSSNIHNYSHQLQQWRNSLTDNANIILYGCSVAAGDRGHQFLTQLHQLTGANIAANPHPTGNSTLGGTWDILQLIPPSSEAPQLALTETTLKTYSGVLGFATQVEFPTGNRPYSVSIGDFNGDGLPDLAVANYGSSTASILLNTTPTGATTPTFATNVDFPTGINPRFVSIGDFNRDNLPDIAVANSGGNTASILLNTTATNATTPSFAPQVLFPTGNRPFSVSIGDFNGDNLPDLAVANFNDNSASILLNTTPTGAATPTFAPQVPFPTGTRPRSVSIGDFNGDNLPDLAVANSGSNTASILLNTTPTGAATPTFAPQFTFPTGSDPFSVSIGDINGDNLPDLAVANFNSNTASILLNTTATGAATPTFAPQVPFPTGNQPVSVSIGDFNGDGKPDLALGNFISNNASILLNTTPTNAATPTFATNVEFPTGFRPFSLSIGDINGDGKPDLAVPNSLINDTASILLNYTPTVSIAAGTTPTETGPTTGTFNITLDTPAPAGGIVVNFNTTGSTAATPGHYSLTAGTNITAVTANTFTIATGVTTAVLNAVPIDDAIVNPGETVQVNVTADPNNFNYFLDPVAANTTGTLTIADNDFPTVNLSVSPVTSTETGTPVITVTATASSAVVGDQTVNVALSGTATAADFTGTIPTSISIPAGQTTGSFTVNVNDDPLVEGSETGTFTISTPSSGITLGTTTTGDVAITDNDFPTVNLSVSPVTSTETGTPVITVTATASSAVVGPQTVNVALSGTATAADFTTIPNIITIPDGQTTGSFTVNVIDDPLVEGSETGTFTISTPSSGVTLGTTTTGNVEITDNDVTPLPEIQVLDGTTDIADGTASTIDFGSA